MTWTRIKQKPLSAGMQVLAHFLPLLVVTSAVQGFGLVHWGKRQGQMLWLKKFPIGETVVFELSQIAIWLIVAFVGARLITNLSHTFHARHALRNALALVTWSLSPLLIVRMADAFTFVSPWLTYLVGIALVLSVLYYGVPIIMEPDPPQAFGLYLGSAIVLVLLTGMARVLFAFYVRGRFPALEHWFGVAGSWLPV